MHMAVVNLTCVRFRLVEGSCGHGVICSLRKSESEGDGFVDEQMSLGQKLARYGMAYLMEAISLDTAALLSI